MSKFLVLTANIGGKDDLRDPKIQFDNCDYIAIVDRSYNLKIWNEYASYNFSNIDRYQNRRNAKLYKVLSTVLFPQYEYVIWLDANHELKEDPENILKEYGDFDMLLFRHPHRNCLYEEMKVVSSGAGLDVFDNIRRQEGHYREDGMPENYGLFEMTCFIQKNCEYTNIINLMWWEQICKFSSRDQCSFTYCLWKSQLKLNLKFFNGFANMYAGGNKYLNEINHVL